MGAFEYFVQLCKQALENNDAKQALEAYNYLVLVFMREDMCKECAACARAIRNSDGSVIDLDRLGELIECSL